MLNGSPLFACRMIPSWLLFQIAAPPVVGATDGAITVESEKVCVWLNGVTPLSRSRFEGSDTRSSWLPTTYVPVSGALSTPRASVYVAVAVQPRFMRRVAIAVNAL